MRFEWKVQKINIILLSLTEILEFFLEILRNFQKFLEIFRNF